MKTPKQPKAPKPKLNTKVRNTGVKLKTLTAKVKQPKVPSLLNNAIFK